MRYTLGMTSRMPCRTWAFLRVDNHRKGGGCLISGFASLARSFSSLLAASPSPALLLAAILAVRCSVKASENAVSLYGSTTLDRYTADVASSSASSSEKLMAGCVAALGCSSGAGSSGCWGTSQLVACVSVFQ
jgi:hypothetical protein